MRQKQNNYPVFNDRDIKVLGRVVTIASENKAVAAEQVFDERFDYDTLRRFPFDNIVKADDASSGFDQYIINRLIGRKVKLMDDAGLVPDEEGWIHNIKIDGLTVIGGSSFSGDTIFNDKTTFKEFVTFEKNVQIDGDLKVENVQVVNELHAKNIEVTENVTVDGDIILEDKSLKTTINEFNTQIQQNTQNIENVTKNVSEVTNKVESVKNDITNVTNDINNTKTELTNKLGDEITKITNNVTQQLSTTVSEEQLNELLSTINKKIEEVNKLVESVQGSVGDIDLSGYYTKAETYNKDEIDGMISGVSGGGDTNNYITNESLTLYLEENNLTEEKISKLIENKITELGGSLWKYSDDNTLIPAKSGTINVQATGNLVASGDVFATGVVYSGKN